MAVLCGILMEVKIVGPTIISLHRATDQLNTMANYKLRVPPRVHKRGKRVSNAAYTAY